MAEETERSRSAQQSPTSSPFASVRRLCNLDRLDSLLQAVLAKVETHDKKLLRVDDDIKSRALGEELGRANASLAKHIQSLAIKVDALQRDVAVTPAGASGSKGSIGSIVSRNGENVYRVSQALASKASHTDVDAVANAVNARFKKIDAKLTSELATTSDVEEMRILVQETISQLSSLEERVARKLDKVELDHLHAAIARIKRFARFQDETTSRLEVLESSSESYRKQIESMQSEMAALTDTVSQHDVRKVSKEEFGALSRRVTRLGDAFDVRRKSTSQAIQTLDEVLSSTAATVKALKAKVEMMDSVDESVQRDVARCLKVCATNSQELVKKVDVLVAEEIFRELKKDITEKAFITSLDDANASIASLKAAHASTSEKLDVALRFVEWFSERGFAFEQNYDVLDRQLQSLSKTAVEKASERAPYEGPFRGQGGGPSSVRLSK